jgi:hypothetical protein
MNNLTSDPIYIDQAGNPLSLGRTFAIFKSVEWVSPEGVGDVVTLRDARGYVVCEFTCDQVGKNKIKYFGDNGQEFDGPLNCSQLDSGHLLITQL